ncbi:MAG: prepilin-type N-terminal cleavage/methylation domain-containing protein [Deltaproteobacteria bacterium]|nr:prepilin-type N-terminal cleavage/methylation domain-containing protein [Deltaproteobacteria bacterium]
MGVRAGMTLVEVLITIMVLTVGCLAAMRSTATSDRAYSLAGQAALASALAESEIERLKSLSRFELEAEAGLGTRVEANLDRFGLACKGSCPGPAFTRTVRYFPGGVTANSTQVEVEIAWPGGGGRRRVVRGTTVTWLSF